MSNYIMNDRLFMVLDANKKELGRLPYFYEYKYSRTACSRFGNWNNFLVEAGYEKINYPDISHLSNKSLIEMLHDTVEKLGRLPIIQECPYPLLIIERFRDWDTFLRTSGYKVQKRF